MGKASRTRRTPDARPKPAPFVARPFAGLPMETDWVAMREILPAATAQIRLRPGATTSGPSEATVATVLPMGWSALHRSGGTVLVATQSSGASGDYSRDLAAALLQALSAPEGTPVVHAPHVTAQTPRLQDLIAPDATFEVTVHEGFDYWVADAELDDEARAALEHANSSVVPTVAMAALPSAYWVSIGERAFVRLVLPDEEDAATDALARLHASGEDSLGEGTRLLGAFRACGLIIPVWDLDPDRPAADYEGALADLGVRYAASLADTSPLTADQRRARAGLLSRQVTLR